MPQRDVARTGSPAVAFPRPPDPVFFLRYTKACIKEDWDCTTMTVLLYCTAPVFFLRYTKACKYQTEECVCCVLSSHLFWTSGLWTYQPGSHRIKVTRDFSTLLLRCLPLFFSREGFSRFFPSSTVKSKFVY